MRPRYVGCLVAVVVLLCGGMQFFSVVLVRVIAGTDSRPAANPQPRRPHGIASVGSVPNLGLTIPQVESGLVKIEGSPFPPIPEESVRGTIAIFKPVVGLLRQMGDTPARGRGCLFLASLHAAVGEFVEADRLFEEARKILASHPEAASWLVWNYMIQGNIQLNRGQYADAIRLYRAAAAVRLPNDRDSMELRAAALQNLAMVHVLLGDPDKAEAAFLDALDVLRRAGSVGTFAHQVVRSNLAIFYGHLGDLETAKQSLQTVAAEPGLNRFMRIQLLNNLGGVLYEKGEFAEAERQYVRATALTPERSPLRAALLANEAAMYSHAGRLDRSETTGEEARRLVNSLFGEDSKASATVVTELATVALRRGRLEEAERMFVRACEIFKTQHDDEALSVATRGLALVAERLGQHQRAIDLSRSALDFAELHLHRILAFGSEMQRLAYQSHAAPYDQLATLGEPNLLAEAVLTMKGAVLESLLAERAVARGSSPAEQAQLDRINLLKVTIMERIGRGDTQPGGLEEALKREQTALARTLAPRLSAVRVDVRSVQSKLKPGEVLVEIVRFRRYDEKDGLVDAYGAVVLPHDGSPAWVPLEDARIIDKAINSAVKPFGGGRGTMPVGPHSDPTSDLRDLYALLWVPLAKTFPSQTRRILLSPDGETSFVPWAALLDEKQRFVAERWQVTQIGSGRDLLRTATASPVNTLLALGDGANNLQYSRQEIDAIEKAAKRCGWSTTVLLGEEASERELFLHPRPRILHVATHGGRLRDGLVHAVQTRLSRNPMYRGYIVLGGGTRTLDAWTGGAAPWVLPFTDDGILTAEEASTLDLRDTWLTVLSACETGTGAARPGEGVMGLRRGFALAGTQNLVFTLWAVDDRATADFMKVFYARLFKAGNPSQALHDAQVAELLRWKKLHGAREAVYRAGGFVLSR